MEIIRYLREALLPTPVKAVTQDNVKRAEPPEGAPVIEVQDATADLVRKMSEIEMTAREIRQRIASGALKIVQRN